MTDPLRLTILRAHNNYRSQLAKVLVTDVTNKTLPAGKNIYKLVYNLTIEKVAQATANMCKMEHPGTVGYGENLWANSWAMDNLTEAVIGAPLSWWSEKDQCPINACKLHVTPQVFDKCGHMTTVAWSHTTQIGCGIQLCPAQDWCSGWVSILINELKHRTK
uniref:SCP domain-containing protein n=1 Tax=Meloidogyne javanica TaxID=6303 RepID=A0A915LQM0_MELJA